MIMDRIAGKRRCLNVILSGCVMLLSIVVSQRATINRMRQVEMTYITKINSLRYKVGNLCDANRLQETILKTEFPHVKLDWYPPIEGSCN